jgi:predicted  nucleic acid-binding Zn-ribbon protein
MTEESTIVFGIGIVAIIGLLLYLSFRFEKQMTLVQTALTNSANQNASALSANTETVANNLTKLTSAYLETAERHSRKMETSQQALEQIGQNYKNLLSELNVTVRELTTVLNTIQDFEGLKTWGKNLEDATEPLRTISSNIAQIEETNRANVKGMESLLARWSQHHELVEKTYQDSVENLNQWTIAQGLSSQQNNQEFRIKLNEISGFYQESTNTLKGLDRIIENERKLHEDLQSNLPSILTKLNDLTATLQETQRKQTELASTLQDIGKPMTEITKNTRTQVNEILQTIQDQTRHQTQIQHELSDSLHQMSNETKEANKEMLNGIFQFENRLENVLPTRTLYFVQLGLLVVIALGVVAVAVIRP